MCENYYIIIPYFLALAQDKYQDSLLLGLLVTMVEHVLSVGQI